MSKYHVSHSQESVMRVIQTMDKVDIEQHFGIEIDEDGSVWDGCEGRTFATLAEWALFMDECEDAAYDAAMYKGNTKYAYDDDY